MIALKVEVVTTEFSAMAVMTPFVETMDEMTFLLVREMT
jgi:hypothetical protein